MLLVGPYDEIHKIYCIKRKVMEFGQIFMNNQK